MNSLNLLSHIGTPPPSPPRSRAPSISNPQPKSGSGLQDTDDAGASVIEPPAESGKMRTIEVRADAPASELDEKTPLLDSSKEGPFPEAKVSKAWLIPKRISDALIGAVRVLLSVVVIPGQYVITCFYDDDGRFSVLSPVYKISRPFLRKRPKPTAMAAEVVSDEKGKRKSRRTSTAQPQIRRPSKRAPSVASSSTAIATDSEMDSERPPTRDEDQDSPSRHTRSRSMLSTSGEEIAPAKRSIRIKLHNDEALRQRKVKKSQQRPRASSNLVSAEAAASLKSPTGPVTSPLTKLTKFPRAPQPPRPLVPRRQPSYTTAPPSAIGPHQKTLIIDLDETLIHSMAKGGRYTTGHMVEVKLQQPMGVGGGMIGPQVPILYYVHKRPHCDEFLKKVGRLRLPCSPIG